jgi:hypothetical protein
VDRLQRLLVRATELLRRQGLVLAKKLGVETHVAGLVHAVNVSEGSRDREVRSDLGEALVHIPNVLRLGVKQSVINACVVNTIFLSAGDADLHLEPEANGCHPLEVLGTDFDVLLLGLLGEIKHVRREQRLLVDLEVALVSLEHAIEPRKKLLGAVVRVKNDRAGSFMKRSRR